jgi:hypothetical protein
VKAKTAAAPLVKYALLCDDIREEKSGKETLVGVYNDKVMVAGLPVVMPKLCFRIKTRPVKKQLDISISIKGPNDGESITGLKSFIPAKPEFPGGNTLSLIMSPFIIKSAGEYSLLIEHSGKEETALIFTVEIMGHSNQVSQIKN